MESAEPKATPGTGSPADVQEEIAIRSLTSLEDLQACVALQKEVWGRKFGEVVPASLLRVTSEMGGVVAGAMDPDGNLVGFVYGITGIRNGRPSHWSHMLGVRREQRGSGVGYRLKLFQRECLLGKGVPEMRWTFDPLIAGNAHFNLTRLGARVEEYVPDMYGDTGSRIHRFGTDRFLVRWALDEPPGTVRDARAAEVDWERTPVLNRGPGAGEAVAGADGSWGPAVRVRIPRNVLEGNGQEPDFALAWRRSSRAAFQDALARGYTTEGFSRESGAAYCHYLLLAPSR